MKRKPHKIPEVLTPDEQARMLAQFNDESPSSVRGRAILRVLLDCGLRAAELVNLRHHDVDIDSGRLWVRAGKGSKDRGLWFNGSSRGALLDWLNLKATLPCGVNFAASGYFFTDLVTGKKKICGRWFRKFTARLAEKAGLDKRGHPHLFRHTFATDMLRQGVNLPTIQKMMGHSDIGTTQIYLSVYDEDVERAMKNFRSGGGSL